MIDEPILRPASRILRASRALPALLAVSAGLLLFSPSAKAFEYGMAWGGYEPRDLELTHRAGASVYRLNLSYGKEESKFEEAASAAWKRGVTLLPVLIRVQGGGTRFLTSSDPQWAVWAAWTKQMVEKYGVNGTFWAGKANPTPITTWEVWNEPNLPQNNPILGGEEKAQPQNFGRFLAHTATAIEAGAAARGAGKPQILFGGLLQFVDHGNENSNKNAKIFLKKACEVGAEVKNAFTGLAIHPYGFVEQLAEMKGYVNEARAQLDGGVCGVALKSLWVTEFGWPVGGSQGYPSGGGSVSEAEQATLLEQSFAWLSSVAVSKSIELAAWYNLRDWYSPENQQKNWDENIGLISLGWAFRPAWYRYQEQAGASEWAMYPQELGFVRFNSANSHLDTYSAGPSYKALASSSGTGYPKITDPENVEALAIDVAGDGLDELGFLRYNPAGSNSHLDTYSGAPNYKTLAASCATAYPKITDPENVQAVALEINASAGEELGFVRLDGPSGAAHIDIYSGGPCFQTLAASNATPYPAVSDPENVRALAIDTDGDGVDELGFLRLKGSGASHLDTYGNAPAYNSPVAFCDTGYPEVSDPENVEVLALDYNGDGVDELGFLRYNPATLNSHLDLYYGAPCYKLLASSSDTAYPKVTDPQNVEVLALNWNKSFYAPPPAWGGGELGGEVVSDPDLSSWGGGRLDIFGRGANGKLKHRALDGGVWFAWDDVPNSSGVSSGPGAVSWGSGRIDVVAQKGTEGAVHHWYYDNSSGLWGNDPQGGKISSDPDIAAWGVNRLDIFARRAEPNSMAHRAWAPGWFPWDTVPNSGTLGSGPGAVSWSSGRIDIVGRDQSTGKVRHWWYDNNVGSWHVESPWDVEVASDPDIASWGPNRLDVFAKGPEGGLIHKSWNGLAWSGWESIGGPQLISGPSAVSWGKGRIDVVARVTGGQIYHWHYSEP